MRRVILESPYAGDVDANVEYARRCVRDSLGRGEAPIASHLLYTQPGILNDDIPHERQWGIDAGLAWRATAEATVVYMDRGMSKGMGYGIEAANDAGVPVEYRWLDDAGTTERNRVAGRERRLADGISPAVGGISGANADGVLQTTTAHTADDQKGTATALGDHVSTEINRAGE
jgi:hypothetical protein